MNNISSIILLILLLSVVSCSPINQNNQDGSFNDTLAGESFEMVNENTQEELIDPNLAEFENAKQTADSIKNDFELEKQNLLRLSFNQESQTAEMKTFTTYYFDSMFILKFFSEISEFAGGGGVVYNLYNPEGLYLGYSHTREAEGSFINIWLNQHHYQEIDVFGSKNYKDDIINHNAEEYDNWKQYTDDKPKQEFTYNADSCWFQLTTHDAPDWNYELRVDSLLFIHLFGE